MPATLFEWLILRAVLRDFRLHRQEKFFYTLGALDRWEWRYGTDVASGPRQGNFANLRSFFQDTPL